MSEIEKAVIEKPVKKRKKMKKRTTKRVVFRQGYAEGNCLYAKLDEEALEKLERAFSLGCTDMEACLIANISRESLAVFQKNNPSWVERKEMLKEELVYRSRGVIATAIENNDVNTAKWYLERKKKDEFSPKYDISGNVTLKQALVEFIDVESEEMGEVVDVRPEECECENISEVPAITDGRQEI